MFSNAFMERKIALTYATVICFGVIILLLSIPAGYERDYYSETLFVTSFIQSIPLSLGITLLSIRFRKIFFCIISTLLILFVIETFCFFILSSRLNANIWLLILQTNANEAIGFFKTYVSNWYIILALLIFITIVSLLYKNLFKFTKSIFFIKTKYLIILFLLSWPLFFLYSYRLPIPVGKSTVSEIYSSYIFLHEVQNDIESIHAMNEKIDIIDLKDSIATVVFIIGESHTKHHSSLYGYYLKTNPVLENEKLSGRLILFENAMSPTNVTYAAMRYMFTQKGCEKEASGASNVLMPVVFRKAGFDIVYLDNQYTREKCGIFDIKCGYFLNTHEVHNYCFNYRNSKTYQYDGDFIDHEKNHLLKHPKSLNIIHIQGQHLGAVERYPQKFGKFTITDIKRDDLDDDERQLIAEYDNATLYNDFVMGKIVNEYIDQNAVIVYVSDHGESVFDNGIRSYGRAPGSRDIHRVKNELHVPMWIWVSDKFINSDKKRYEKILNSSSRPFCTADIPYLLYDLIGLDFNFNDKTKSLISDTFVPHETVY